MFCYEVKILGKVTSSIAKYAVNEMLNNKDEKTKDTGDANIANTVDTKSKTAILKESVEKKKEQTPIEIPSNYFEQLTAKIKAEKSGDSNMVEELEKKINETSFFKKFKDAFNLGAVIKWIGVEWFGGLFSVKEEFQKKKEEIKEKIGDALKNPISILTSILGGFVGFKVLGKLNPLSHIKNLKKAPNLLLKMGGVGIVVFSAMKLYQYFIDNPDEARNMPEEMEARKKWWKGKMEELGLSDERVLPLVQGESSPRDLFPNDEKDEEEEKKDKTVIEDGVEKVPAHLVMENIKEDIEGYMLQAQDFIVKNKMLLTTIGVSIGGIFVIKKGGATAKCLIDTVKSLTKFVGKHPYLTLLTVVAFLLARNFTKDVMVPKDTENFKKWLKQEMVKKMDWFKDMDLPVLTPEKIDIATEIIVDEKKRKDFMDQGKNFASDVVDGAINNATLTPESLILYKNHKGFESFLINLKIFNRNKEETGDYDELILLVETLVEKMDSNQLITSDDIKNLQVESGNVNIIIKTDGELIKWQQLSDQGITMEDRGPKNLCIDPNLSKDDAFSEAKRFVIEHTWSSVFEAGEIPIQQLRLWGGKLFEKAGDEHDVSEIIKGRLKFQGDQLFVVGGEVILQGATERFVLGPYNVLKGLLNWVFKGGEFSAVEFAVDYMEGIVPVMVFGLASSLVRLKNPFKGGLKSMVLQTAIYPISGLIDMKRMLGNHIIPHIISGDYGLILKSPLVQKKSDFLSSLYKWRKIKTKIFGGEAGKKIADCQSALSKMYEALDYTYKSMDLINNDNLHRNIHGLLEEAGKNAREVESLSGGRIADAEIKKVAYYLERAIELEKLKIQKLKEKVHFEKAKKYIEKGRNNPKFYEKAKQSLAKVGDGGELILQKMNVSVEKINGQEIAWDIDIEIQNIDKGISEIDSGDYMRKLPKDPNFIKKSVKKLNDLDKDIERLEAEKIKEKERFLNDNKGKGLTEIDSKQALKNIDDRYDIEIKDLQQKKGELAGQIDAVDPNAMTKRDIELDPDLVKKQQLDIDRIKELDIEVLKLEENRMKERQDVIAQASKEGKTIAHDDVKTRLDAIDAKYDLDISIGYKQRVDLTNGIPIAKIKEHGIEIDPIRAKQHGIDIKEGVPVKIKTKNKLGKLKSIGKGVAGLAIGIAAGMGIGEAVEFFNKEEEIADFQKPEDMDKQKKESVEKMREDNNFHNEVLVGIEENYFKPLRFEYDEILKSISLENLKNIKTGELVSEDILQTKVTSMAKKHMGIFEKIKEPLKVNREAFALFFEKYPDQREKQIRINNYITIKWDEDKNRPYLEYSDEKDFEKSAYETADYLMENYDDFSKGKQPSMWGVVGKSALYMVPVVGTAMDARDCAKSLSRKDYLGAAWSGTWAVVGAVSDAALVIPVLGTAVSVVGKAIRGTGAVVKGLFKGIKDLFKGAKAVEKIENLSKFTKIVKVVGGMPVQMGMAGADFVRSLMTPKRSQKFYF